MTVMEKIQQLRSFVQKENAGTDLNAAAKNMADIIGSDVYFLGKDGKMLGASTGRSDEKHNYPKLNPDIQQRIAFIFQPAVNIPVDAQLFLESNGTEGAKLTIYPLTIAGIRWGNLLMTRGKADFGEDELPILEVAALIADILLSGTGSEVKDTEAQLKSNAHVSLDSLSYSELEAIRNVFAELAADEGFLVASKVADRIGITRSVIVNAMRKLESAGVVESRSLGMKGTYIRVKNPYFLSELAGK